MHGWRYSSREGSVNLSLMSDPNFSTVLYAAGGKVSKISAFFSAEAYEMRVPLPFEQRNGNEYADVKLNVKFRVSNFALSTPVYYRYQ